MTDPQISPEAEFMIDFNVFQVPAIVGMDIPAAAAAQMVGTSEARYLAYAADVETEVNRTAESILADPELALGIDRLGVDRGGTLMAIGDSITAYQYGYARLLAAMIARRRPDDAIEVRNVAQSGYTSSDCLENTFTQFLAHTPDAVLIKLGVNDCKLFGSPDAKNLVSIDEYRAIWRRWSRRSLTTPPLARC